MLFYLDNWLSADPKAAERSCSSAAQPPACAAGRRRQRRRQQPPQSSRAARRGLNENYARELLELHTLGVDGGYTQQDIIEVARAFTGWTIGRGAQHGQDGGFRFAPALHDRGEKMVLGQTIRGRRRHRRRRARARHRRRASVDRAAHRDQARAALRQRRPAGGAGRPRRRALHGDRTATCARSCATLVTSPEFFAAEHRSAKVKTPLEFVVSARARDRARACATRGRCCSALQQLGMPPYMCQPPTGYDDTAEAWVSAGALVTRMNIAQQIAGAQRAAHIGGAGFPAAVGPDRVARIMRHDYHDASFIKSGAMAMLSLGFAPSFLARAAEAAHGTPPAARSPSSSAARWTAST